MGQELIIPSILLQAGLALTVVGYVKAEINKKNVVKSIVYYDDNEFYSDMNYVIACLQNEKPSAN